MCAPLSPLYCRRAPHTREPPPPQQRHDAEASRTHTHTHTAEIFTVSWIVVSFARTTECGLFRCANVVRVPCVMLTHVCARCPPHRPFRVHARYILNHRLSAVKYRLAESLSKHARAADAHKNMAHRHIVTFARVRSATGCLRRLCVAECARIAQQRCRLEITVDVARCRCRSPHPPTPTNTIPPTRLLPPATPV